MRAPLDWTPVTESTLQQVQAGLESATEPDNRFVPEMLTVFRHPTHGAHLAVGRYEPELSPTERDSVVRWQSDGLRERFGHDGVLANRFTHNGCELDQLLPQLRIIRST